MTWIFVVQRFWCLRGFWTHVYSVFSTINSFLSAKWERSWNDFNHFEAKRLRNVYDSMSIFKQFKLMLQWIDEFNHFLRSFCARFALFGTFFNFSSIFFYFLLFWFSDFFLVFDFAEKAVFYSFLLHFTHFFHLFYFFIIIFHWSHEFN